MEIIQAIILGIVQGATEFMPISSSAHLILLPWALGWPDFGLSFAMMLHLGTLVAVLIYFRRDWLRYIRALFGGAPSFGAPTKVGLTATDPTPTATGDAPGNTELASDRRIAWLILLANIPGAIFGFIGESKVEDLFHEPANLAKWGIYIIAAAMIIMGLALALAERRHRGKGKELAEMSLTDALVIGFSQALAIIPGVSRSGVTITAALFRNLERAAAARFSFLLATPIILGAGLKKVYDFAKDPVAANPQNISTIALAAGFITAAVVGYLTIYFLLAYLQRHNTNVFIGYRLVAGVMILIIALLALR